MKTLIVDPLAARFGELVEQNNYQQYFLTNGFQPEEIEIAVVKTFTRVDEGFLQKYPNLKLIIRAGSGYDNIDLEATRSRNVIVCNTPDANVIAAFEHTISLILALIKGHRPGMRNLEEKTWKEGLPRNWEISDLRVLIVGVGRIGNRVAGFLQRMGAEVRGVDPYLTQEEWQQKRVKEITYQKGIKWCNLISYHCPLTTETENYFNKQTLQSLIQPVWLINTARGGIINEEVLLQGLQEGKILGAGLDVFVNEPQPELPYRNFENIYLTPHTGAFTNKAQHRLAEEIIHIWEAFVFHKRIINEVKSYAER